MAKRGASLSVKMILTTTLLIIVTVVGFGALNVVNVRRAFDNSTQKQIEIFRTGRESLGELETPLFARAVSQLLYDKGRDNDILSIVEETVALDTKAGPDGKRDFGLRLAIVLDLNQKVIAHCVEAEKLACALDNHEPMSPAISPVAAGAWSQALVAWQAAAAGKDEPMVRFDIPGAAQRVFAFPVFGGATPTAKGALAADAPDARLGYVVLGYDLAPVAWFATAASEQKADASARAALYTGAVGGLFVLIGTVLAIFQGLSISRPIKQLAWKADQIARGDLAARVEVTSNDEIGFLGENFNFMAEQITILVAQTVEAARLEQELEVAKTIQETLVPPTEPIDKGVLEFAGYYQPAAQTGGDWWTWNEVGEDKYLLVIGDVTGHGVPSAMITAAAKAASDVARYVHGDALTVSRLLEIMNHAIYESAQRKFVMTCFAAIIDTKTRSITYANAGHNFPYLFRQGDFGSLMVRGNRLGDERASRYEAKTTDLLAGDVLVFYTDGLVECENPAGEEYGEKRFRASVKRASTLGAGAMRDAIVGEASTFFAEAQRKDDITMIVGRIR